LVEKVADIRGLHHIHIWELTSKMYVLTAHVEVDDIPLSQVEGIRSEALSLLEQEFGIAHASLEFEVKKG